MAHHGLSPPSDQGQLKRVRSPGLGEGSGSNYSQWYVGYPGLIYNLRPHIQLWGGLLGVYTDNDPEATGKPDTLELRPYIGAKLFLPNKKKWNIYNLTRLEFRETYSHGTHEWTNVERLRARFGIETPFGDREKAWKPGSFYGMANTEPMYVFDKNDIDPFRIQVGAGYIPDSRVRIELLYYMNWGRVAPANDLAFTQNIIRLTVKVSTSRGLLNRVWNPAD